MKIGCTINTNVKAIKKASAALKVIYLKIFNHEYSDDKGTSS
jgi:hypothetical protein